MPFKQLRHTETNEKTTIRRASAGDYGRVIELLTNAKLTDDSFFTRDRFVDALIDFGKYNLVAERDGKVVGYIFGYDDSGRSGKPKFYGYMGRLVVDPEYRNLGIGRSLMENCLAEFKRSGYSVVYIGIKKGNIASLELSKKLGFSDDGYYLLSIY